VVVFRLSVVFDEQDEEHQRQEGMDDDKKPDVQLFVRDEELSLHPFQ
jgi:hypothetical protein